ncbi:helix-turn-helix domain-containing protein [Rhizobium wenxiniae]|uniref:helix-turn-helix domain-containing protein n=1 Tax=Rhizobium wenxiniae TaxID=1737357 RepID=UPI001CB78DD6
MPAFSVARQPQSDLDLERARDLLQNTMCAVVDIAFDVGYSSASHFTKAFRLACGETPLGVRR